MGASTLDFYKAQSARLYDYLLGGNVNFPADREAAAMVMEALPTVRIAAWVNRQFMHRSTRYLAATGMEQFLDIGIGIPTSPNLHEVAQQENPAARVVYADNDPIVLTHAEMLMNSSPQGRIAVVDASLTEPEGLLASRKLTDTIDLDAPVALSLNTVLYFLPDDDRPHAIVETLKKRLVPGSTLTITHFTQDFAPEAVHRASQAFLSAGIRSQARSLSEFARLVDGWELIDPGITVAPHWRPDPADEFSDATDVEASCYVVVARKPAERDV